MTREEFLSLSKRVEIATELFNKHAMLQNQILVMSKCFVVVRSADDVRSPSIPIENQAAIRDIVLEQLNKELADVTQKIEEQ